VKRSDFKGAFALTAYEIEELDRLEKEAMMSTGEDTAVIEVQKIECTNRSIEIRNVGKHTLTVQRPDGTELEIKPPRSEGDHRARKVVPDGSMLVRMKR